MTTEFLLLQLSSLPRCPLSPIACCCVLLRPAGLLTPTEGRAGHAGRQVQGRQFLHPRLLASSRPPPSSSTHIRAECVAEVADAETWWQLALLRASKWMNSVQVCASAEMMLLRACIDSADASTRWMMFRLCCCEAHYCSVCKWKILAEQRLASTFVSGPCLLDAVVLITVYSNPKPKR